MRRLLRLAVIAGAAGGLVFAALLLTDGIEPIEIERPADAALISAEKGELLLGLAGCVNCHTAEGDGAVPLAGGRALETPFGVFYAPNITSDAEHGIGAWSEEDFVRALRFGRSPDGGHYFPAFPYVAYTQMTDADMLAVRAAIMARAGVAQPSKPHDIGFPFNQRWTMRFWKLLHFDAGTYAPDAARSAAWNRGAYISEALAHCGECHTPRWPTGGLDRSRWLAGSAEGVEGEKTPNITPHDGTGLGAWSDSDVAFALQLGMKVDGDVVGSVMYEVIENGAGKLSDEDIAAIVEYLKSVPPIDNPDAPSAQPF